MATPAAKASPLPRNVTRAVVELISAARLLEVPILDVEATACAVVAAVPEAATVDAVALRDQIAHVASREPGLGLALPARHG